MTAEGKRNKAALKKQLGIEDKKVVLFVGRLGEKKGAEKLIAAMKNVMEKRSDVALVVIGSKWYGSNTTDDYTKSVVAFAKSLSGPVIFTGYLPHEVIPAYYNLGDIFVCPSECREPVASVHYEAMAAGLPIITTNRGGNREVVEGYEIGSVIDDYSNPDAFSEQISALLDNPEKACAMGLKGRMLAEERYNWKRVAGDLLKLFKTAEESDTISEKQAPDISSEENKAINQAAAEQPSEINSKDNNEANKDPINQTPEVDDEREKLNVFRKMIRNRYPYMPDYMFDYLEEYKDYFLQGDL
jgi:spore coat protein SA